MPDPSTLLLATCMGCVSELSTSQTQAIAQAQQFNAEPIRSSDVASSHQGQSVQGQSVIPTTAPPSVQLQVDRRVDSDPQFPIAYLWILGWAVVYGGGSLFVMKEVAEEMNGVQVVKTPVQEKDFAAALERLNAQPSAESLALPGSNTTHPAPPQQSTAKSSTSTPSTATPKLIAKAIEPHADQAKPFVQVGSLQQKVGVQIADQVLEVAQAEQGRVEPLYNLFVGLPQPDLAPNLKSNNQIKNNQINQTGLIAPAQSKKAERPQIDNQEALNKLIQKAHPTLPIKESTIPLAINKEEETLIATLPIPKQEETYTYTLLDDAGGLFVLRGLELRMLNHQLQDHPEDATVVTVRRTDAQGMSVDKSFKLEIKKMQHQSAPQKTVERVPVQV